MLTARTLLRCQPVLGCFGRRYSSSVFPPMTQPLEEATLPWYKAEQFYPVRIGEFLDSRFKVLGKLGYGAYSTVWLCRNTCDSSFVAVKVCTREGKSSPGIHRELRFYEHVSSLDSQHLGQACIRGLYETFDIAGPDGTHLCLVQPPMHMTIRELQFKNDSCRLNVTLLKWTLRNLFFALSFLHDEAGVVHSDINPSNIMFTISDDTILEDFEKAEAEDPSPRQRIDDTRTIYASRKLGLPKGDLWGQPILCDFGEARIGKTHTGLIQPELYRAPEVLFDMSWDASVDIWSVGCLIWDLFENRHLFNAQDEDGKSSATHHVAEMVAYLGPPPLEYLQRNEVTENVFNQSGQWKGAGGVVVPQISLENSVSVLEGETKQQFLDFVKRMLHWLPQERSGASKLLQDPWMSKII